MMKIWTDIQLLEEDASKWRLRLMIAEWLVFDKMDGALSNVLSIKEGAGGVSSSLLQQLCLNLARLSLSFSSSYCFSTSFILSLC